jgi:hypothetical protein
MTTPVRNLVGGTAVAAVLAIVMYTPTIAGVSTWKWLLGLAGLSLWLGAGPPRAAVPPSRQP